MKKILACILLTAAMIGLWGCAGEAAPPQTARTPNETSAAAEIPSVTAAAAESTAGETQAATVQTEPPVLEDPIFLKVSSITFSVVGESDDIYLGMIPRELITWESDDPDVVSVENGVLTATGVGTTTVRATYNDRQVQCSAGCLAQTREELNSLDQSILSAPKCVLPEVDLNTPCTYFDGCAIVGDSITYMLLQSESKGDYLGDILFLARGGTSLNGFVNRFKNLYYQGAEMYLEDAVAKSQAKRIYILIGSNDIGSEPQREIYFENWDIILGRIREKSPDVEIVLISNIPQGTKGKGNITVYNRYVAEFNEKMRLYAQENDCMYLDLCYYLSDHMGKIPAGYDLDGFHLNDAGYHIWMQVMRYYAQYEQNGGTLS